MDRPAGPIGSPCGRLLRAVPLPAPHRLMFSTRSTRVLVIVLALAAIGCDGARSRATYANISGTYALFALTGAPANAPTALKFLGGALVADANFDFDVAADIDPAGAARIYPVRTLASGLANSGKRIGLQVVGGSFEALREAPKTGYDTAGFKVIVPGSVVAVEIQDLTTCLYSIGGTALYAKLVVDSIRSGERRIFGRTVVDPNCGFRELMPDTVPAR